MRIAIVGATGQVGVVLRAILAERHFPVESMRYLASARSAGTTLPWGDRDIVVEDAETADLSGIDLALCSAPASVSRALAPRLAAAGAIVIDNSSAWRMDPEVPLVVPEANAAELRSIPKGIVANPNCTTMVAIPVLKPLDDEAGLTRLVVSTYQAVSGGGVEAVRELAEQLSKTVDRAADLTFDGSSVDFPPRSVYPVPIAHNVIPLQFKIVDDGSLETDEEQKYCNEARKILGRPDLAVTTTCVRVPVFTGHSAAIVCEFERPITPERATEVLRAGAGRRAGRDPDAAAGGRPRRFLCRPHPAGPGCAQRTGPLRLGRQPAQGRRAQRGADRRGVAGPALLSRRPSGRLRLRRRSVSPVRTRPARARRSPGWTDGGPG